MQFNTLIKLSDNELEKDLQTSHNRPTLTVECVCCGMLAITDIIETLPVVHKLSSIRGGAKFEFIKLENEKMWKGLYLLYQADSMGCKVFAYRSTFTFDFLIIIIYC